MSGLYANFNIIFVTFFGGVGLIIFFRLGEGGGGVFYQIMGGGVLDQLPPIWGETHPVLN